MDKIRVTIWSEGIDPELEPRAIALYPNDINTYLAGALGAHCDFEIRTANLSDPECGLSQQIIDETDVLVWWSHLYDDQVSEQAAERVMNAVLNGMGLVLLHAGFHGKPARKLLGCPSPIGKYRELGEMERMWVVDRSHPILAGLQKEYIEIPCSEMYGEPGCIPNPDELVFISWFEGGEVLRSVCGWHKGAGKVFYLAPGHEEFPVYYIDEIQLLLANIIRYVKPVNTPRLRYRGEVDAIETLKHPVKSSPRG